ncbi:NB-ARC domain-containing protein [Streptomyces sp. NPDC046881]|uniref:NB-ARC domain-containing protein n=1 Tax=Streptomyces sp. NPDC046881 TaxID=3155374 RepID=UPI0033CA6D53
MPQVLDPGKARTMDEFIAELRLLKAWAGNPSITEITRRIHHDWQRAGRPRSEWPARSTIGNCFQLGRRRPNPDLLLAVVRVLADGDEAAVALWRQALRTVLGEAEAAARVSAYDRLPAAPPRLVGRSRPVSDAEAAFAAAGQPGVLVLEGAPGVGKTSLALHIAHRLSSRKRPDAPVLFANLRGFAPNGPAADPAAVLETFLRLLGVAGDRIPHGLGDRASLYRRLLAGSGALVVLDDAEDGEHVRALLPGDPTCRTLVTSRRTLHALPGVTRLTVDPLAPDDAVELLRRTAATDAAATDTAALRRIADDLGHLPLGLTVIGRHMREHPGWTLDDYYREPVITIALEDGVRGALAASDAQLGPGSRRLLRLLALHPLHRTDVAGAAALTGEGERAVRDHLRALSAAHLVVETEPGWFHTHALVRAYAEERVCIDVPGTSIRQALGRVLSHCWATQVRDPAHAPGELPVLRRLNRAEAWADALPARETGAARVLAA